jgi:small subunit ribosomal protein S2
MAELLVPLQKYMQSGIHIGSKFKTKFMEPYVFKVRPDGLSVFNIQKINDKLDAACKFISQYDADKILIVCRKESGKKPLKMLSKITGIRVITGRYLPGSMTNPNYLGNYMEPEILFVCDPWTDRQAIKDALKIGIPIIALCDTNNTTNNLDLVVPCNNKGKKALSLIFYILAREYLKAKGKIKSDKEFNYKLKDFT